MIKEFYRKFLFNLLKDEIRKEINKTAEKIIKVIYLDKKTDEEIKQEYKHDRFRDVSEFEQEYIFQRFELQPFWKNTGGYKLGLCVAEGDYIVDAIETAERIKNEEAIEVIDE